MPIVFGVALGGALGASTRYGLDRLIALRIDGFVRIEPVGLGDAVGSGHTGP